MFSFFDEFSFSRGKWKATKCVGNSDCAEADNWSGLWNSEPLGTSGILREPGLMHHQYPLWSCWLFVVSDHCDWLQGIVIFLAPLWCHLWNILNITPEEKLDFLSRWDRKLKWQSISNGYINYLHKIKNWSHSRREHSSEKKLIKWHV